MFCTSYWLSIFCSLFPCCIQFTHLKDNKSIIITSCVILHWGVCHTNIKCGKVISQGEDFTYLVQYIPSTKSTTEHCPILSCITSLVHSSTPQSPKLACTSPHSSATPAYLLLLIISHPLKSSFHISYFHVNI